jgi:hypothetical protein
MHPVRRVSEGTQRIATTLRAGLRELCILPNFIRLRATGKATPAPQSADLQIILTVETCIYIINLDND